jgi:hypothetical protein
MIQLLDIDRVNLDDTSAARRHSRKKLWQKIQTAMTAAAMAESGEVEMARQIIREASISETRGQRRGPSAVP